MITKFLVENFLVHYYFLESVCTDFVSEDCRREMFYSLAEIFCLDKRDELDTHYAQTCLDWVRDIEDLPSYERVCRMLEFAEMSGQKAELTDLDKLTLMSKRTAMVARGEVFRNSKTLTANTLTSMLHESAANGSIYAMGALSFMEYHGICIQPDPEHAVRRIRPCAKWNDVFGNLMGIKYDVENAYGYYARLRTVLDRAGHPEVFRHVCQYNGYTFTGKPDELAGILAKAFAMNVVKKETFDRTFASMLFSDIIPVEDKERMALSKQKEWSSAIPFDTEHSRRMTFDVSCIDRLPLDRKEESEAIAQNLTFAAICPNFVYKPLLIASGDEFISDMYAEMIKDGLGDSSVVEVDATKLHAVELSPTVENVFIRSICDTKSASTVFIIKNCEGLKPESVEDLMKLMDYSARKRFKLVQSSFSLDLSAMKFVLLADEGGWQVKTLSSVCDTVWAKGVTKSEMPSVIDTIIKSRVSAFAVGEIKLEPQCYQHLAEHSVSELKDIVDAIVKDSVLRQNTTVSLDSVMRACKSKNISHGTQGFGFMGGIKNNA